METGPLEHKRQLPSEPAPLAGGQRLGPVSKVHQRLTVRNPWRTIRGFSLKYVYLYVLALK